jgi:hypothetical protein
MQKQEIIKKCRELLNAYKKGLLGNTIMPEESHPNFDKMHTSEKLTYFTLPMALNYQRDSYKLWQAALATYNDKETKWVFDVKRCAKASTEDLQKSLLKHKLALQPNKHTSTWLTISRTIVKEFGSIEELFQKTNNDFLKLKEMIQTKCKKGFPYLSGPKIFNYWLFIIQQYGGVKLINSECIEIAPDTHVTQCSMLLELITQKEAEKISKEKLSEKWRTVLEGTGITPIEMHPPLWFWSRNNFEYKLKK